MTTAALCQEHDTRCAMELDEERYTEWQTCPIIYVRKAVEVDWRMKMRRKLELESRMSLV